MDSNGKATMNAYVLTESELEKADHAALWVELSKRPVVILSDDRKRRITTLERVRDDEGEELTT
jgi:hypothetical protein